MTYTVTSTTITINSANKFEIVFNKTNGGQITTWYDLENDPGKAANLTTGNSMLWFDLTDGVQAGTISDTLGNEPRIERANDSSAVVRTNGNLGSDSNFPFECIYTVYSNGLIIADLLVTNNSGGVFMPSGASAMEVGLALNSSIGFEDWLGNYGVLAFGSEQNPDAPLAMKWLVSKLSGTGSIIFADSNIRHRTDEWKGSGNTGNQVRIVSDNSSTGFSMANGEQLHAHFLLHLKPELEDVTNFDDMSDTVNTIVDSYLRPDTDVEVDDGLQITDMAGDWDRDVDDSNIVTTGDGFNERHGSYTIKAFSPHVDVVESI